MYRHGVSLGTFLFGVLKGVLREWLGALTYCVSDITVSNTISRSDPASIQDTSLLQDDLEELLTVVLGLAWHKDSALAAGAAPLPVPFSRPPYTHFCLDTLVNFLCHLVSANGCFVEPCLRVLVQHMLPPEGA
jgi:hypothetical protein